MAVRFVLGRSGTGKTSYCVRAIAGALQEPSEQPLLFLVPEQATYQAERAILGDERIAGYHRLHILSFKRLQSTLLGRSTAWPELSKIGRQMVVHKILRDNLDKLQVFGPSALMPGFAGEMASTITELHRYAKGPEDVEELIEHLTAGGQRPEAGELKTEDSTGLQLAGGGSRFSALKFADIALVFRRYSEALWDKFIDPDAQIVSACKAVAKADFIKGARLWVDGFASFTGGEMALLIEILKAVDEAYMALCVDPADIDLGANAATTICNPQSAIRSSSDRPGLFEPTARTYRDMLERLGEAKVKVGEPVILADVGRFRDCAALAHVEQNVFRLTAPKSRAAGAIRLVAAPSLRLEIQFVARQILSLVREQGYRYCDMAVVASDLSQYEQYVRAYFEDYGVPFFIDKRKGLNQHPVVELVCAALQAVIGGFAHADIFAYLKTGLVPMRARDVDTLENYCVAFGVDGRDWTSSEPWRFKEADDEEFDEEAIDRIRIEAAGPLRELRASLCPDGDLQKKLTAGEFTRIIFSFLDRLEVRRTVALWIEEAHASGDLTAADEHRQLFDAFVDLFDTLVEIFEREQMTAQDYLGLLASAFSQMTLAFIPPSLDQVLVGSIERSRHPSLKAIFLLGATQRQFPIPLASSGVLSDDDRDLAEAVGFDLAPSSRQSLTDRQYLAYIAFTRPSKFMCISYPCVDEKGSQIMRSHFIDELQSLFEDVAEEYIADSLLTLDEVQNGSELGELLCSRLGRDVSSMGVPPMSSTAVPAVSTTGIPCVHGRGVLPAEELSITTRHDGKLPHRTETAQGQDAPQTHGRDAHATHGQDARATQTVNDNDLAGLLRAMQSDSEYEATAGRLVSALSYDNRASLESDVVSELFGKRLPGSATRLGTFAACPYRHFAKYVLSLKPRREFKLEPLDVGLFYHRALDALHKRLMAEKQDWAEIEDDRLVQLLRDEVARLSREDKFLSQFIQRSLHNAFVIGSAGRILEESVLGFARMIRAGSFRPFMSEVAFGAPPDAVGKLGRFELPLPAGQILSLDGKIDRLDIAEIDGRKVALILDYKRTRSGARFDWGGFCHGLDVQLAIYMLAVHHCGAGVAEDIAGALYIPVETVPETASLPELAEKGPRRFPYKARGIINGAYCHQLDPNCVRESAFYSFCVTAKDQQPYGRYGTSNALRPKHFARLLDWSRQNLIRLATDILSGRIESTPYHRGSERACMFCDYMGVCRFDWQINDYNFLRPIGKADLMAELDSE